MAARFSVRLLISCFVVPLCISSVSSRRDRSSIKGIFRSRRETCVDGTYDFQGRTCCKCPAGQRVKTDCSTNPNDGKCEICENGTYISEPSSEKKCLPCTSCGHDNANLEEEVKCTPATNRKCRCKNGFFCSSSKECIICHPCTTCGFGGIKEKCTPTRDTVCNGAAGATAGIVVLVVVLVVGAIIAAGYFRIRRKKKEQERKGENICDAVIPLLQGDIMPLLPDIANELGWWDMKSIAIRTGVANGIIESCELHPNPEERTLQLLMRWAEKEGKEAPRKLIQTLKNMDKKGKAEKIIDILSNANSASSDNPGTNN